MATIQQLEKLHHIQRLFHVEDSLEAAVAGERVKLLIEKTEQLIRQRAFLREERRVLRISAEKLEERKQELGLMNGKDWVPQQLRKLPPRCIQVNIAGLVSVHVHAPSHVPLFSLSAHTNPFSCLSLCSPDISIYTNLYYNNRCLRCPSCT